MTNAGAQRPADTKAFGPMAEKTALCVLIDAPAKCWAVPDGCKNLSGGGTAKDPHRKCKAITQNRP
ncbi:hypothetical protein [Croceicoccus ponticola]|uniref:hypothetical protein n=1 Tax=Croceicoccus ponticola TaxID=2217664 RepID=UPI00196AEF5E|nr:hypothetical protein [Croceicoccus ponticola]